VAAALALLSTIVVGEAPAAAQLARDSSVVTRDAWPSCAGDGLPPPVRTHPGRRVPYVTQLSVLAEGWGVAWTGPHVRMSDLDAADGSGLYLSAGRLGACGRVDTGQGDFTWNVVYEPYAFEEAAQPDSRPWGRFLAGEVGFAPWRWLTLSVGLRKVAFSYGHDEPLQLRALPVRPYVSQSIAPDRRLGLTLDDDFGVAHVVVGVYQGARDLAINTDGGMLIAARLVAEPLGPVGNAVTTAFDPAYWRARPPRFAVNASVLYQYVNGSSTYALGGDGALHWGPLGLVAEYIFSSGTTVEAPVLRLPRLKQARQGAYLEAAWMLWRPWLEVAARYDWLDEPHQPGQRFHAVTAGVTFYAFRQLLRVQSLYTHKIHYGVAASRPAIEDDVFMFAASFALEKAF